MILLKIGVFIAFSFMIGVNYLANALPLGGNTTGDISNQYDSLFTPAGFTFSIWGLIYLMLGIYVVLVLFGRLNLDHSSIRFVAIMFMVSCLFNVAWLFAWHHNRVGISALVLMALLVTLILIVTQGAFDRVLVRSIFSLYLGWVSVAVIANVTIYLVAVNFRVPGISELAWFMMITVVGVVLAYLMIRTRGDVVFMLVFVWAYFGILVRHAASQNPIVTYHMAVLVFVLALMSLYQFITNGLQLYP